MNSFLAGGAGTEAIVLVLFLLALLLGTEGLIGGSSGVLTKFPLILCSDSDSDGPAAGRDGCSKVFCPLFGSVVALSSMEGCIV